MRPMVRMRSSASRARNWNCLDGRLVADGVRYRVDPVLGWLDPRFDACVFGEQVEQVRTAEQLQWLVFGELERRLPVTARGDENAFRSAFVLNRPEQVAHSANPDGVLVPLRLDDDFAAEDRVVVVGDAVDASVARRLGLPRFQAHLPEEVGD